ncbi:MAG: hypothetical protein WD989_00840 [Candidatus Paceibacterota bacterium]
MGHYWREMDPAGAEKHDRKLHRRAELRKKIKSMSLGEFAVNELEAVMRLLGLAHNEAGTLEPHEEHLTLLEKKTARRKRDKKI